MPTLVRPPVEQRSQPGHEPGSAAYNRILVALFAAGMATFALLYSTQALLHELVEAIDVSATQSTLTMSLTTGALAVSLLVAGPLSDRIGRTRLIHVSLAASTLVAAACAVAPTWEALLVLRLAAGVTLAGLPAVATAYLREELHPSTHGRAAGLYVAGTALGGMAGRLVTAPVAEAFGWRWALAAAAALALVCTVVVALTLPASQRFTPRPAGARSVGHGAAKALGDPTLLALYAAGSLTAGTMVAVFNAVGFRLTDAPFSLGVAAVSLVFLVYPLGALSSILAGRLADALGRRAIAPIGCAVTVGGVLLTLPAWLPTVVTGVAAVTIGFFMVHAVASGWVVARAHAADVSTGQAAAFYLFFYYAGSSVFGSLGGHAWSVAGWPGVVVLALLLLTAATGISLALRKRLEPGSVRTSGSTTRPVGATG